MAYENGYEVVNYIGNCIERYRKDPLIFTKATQLIPVYMLRKDWPFCVKDLDKTIKEILGDSLSSIASFVERYLDDPRIVWPENLPERFLDDLKIFHETISPIIKQASLGVASPLRFAGVNVSFYNDRPPLITIIRLDGEKLDLEITVEDLETTIQILNDILSKTKEKEVGRNEGNS
ncbi:hypothetical protein ciss_06960 [Carboxydothermus islandicus]|uniref:Uncharacterized protein n=2 Tax=Carboxydothermus islandicus TaxID=661089 RepID=A0A1L8D0U9_9THEO|nr:hypothetical protein ciss_06960 [Carboxydothermus islandicus]